LPNETLLLIEETLKYLRQMFGCWILVCVGVIIICHTNQENTHDVWSCFFVALLLWLSTGHLFSFPTRMSNFQHWCPFVGTFYV
jgi:hypothetical protein